MAAWLAKSAIRVSSSSLSGRREKLASTPSSESRKVSGQPAKETRPFSRAQAGSAIRSSFATSFVHIGSRVSAMRPIFRAPMGTRP